MPQRQEPRVRTQWAERPARQIWKFPQQEARMELQLN
jgi:hypothetical protein